MGNVLLLTGRMNAAFGSSMEIEVEVHSENPLTGEHTLTTTALITMVGVEEHNRPCRVPKLEAANDDERRRAEEATERRHRRLVERKKR